MVPSLVWWTAIVVAPAALGAAAVAGAEAASPPPAEAAGDEEDEPPPHPATTRARVATTPAGAARLNSFMVMSLGRRRGCYEKTRTGADPSRTGDAAAPAPAAG